MDRLQPETYWFKRSDPWNVTPRTWQGWALTIGFLGLLAGGSAAISRQSPLLYWGYMAGVTVVYVSIAWWTCEPRQPGRSAEP